MKARILRPNTGRLDSTHRTGSVHHQSDKTIPALSLSSSSIESDDEDNLHSSNEYNVWDNSELTLRGISSHDFCDFYGKPISFLRLFKIRSTFYSKSMNPPPLSDLFNDADRIYRFCQQSMNPDEFFEGEKISSLISNNYSSRKQNNKQQQQQQQSYQQQCLQLPSFVIIDYTKEKSCLQFVEYFEATLEANCKKSREEKYDRYKHFRSEKKPNDLIQKSHESTSSSDRSTVTQRIKSPRLNQQIQQQQQPLQQQQQQQQVSSVPTPTLIRKNPSHHSPEHSPRKLPQKPVQQHHHHVIQTDRIQTQPNSLTLAATPLPSPPQLQIKSESMTSTSMGFSYQLKTSRSSSKNNTFRSKERLTINTNHLNKHQTEQQQQQQQQSFSMSLSAQSPSTENQDQSIRSNNETNSDNLILAQSPLIEAKANNSIRLSNKNRRIFISHDNLQLINPRLKSECSPLDLKRSQQIPPSSTASLSSSSSSNLKSDDRFRKTANFHFRQTPHTSTTSTLSDSHDMTQINTSQLKLSTIQLTRNNSINLISNPITNPEKRGTSIDCNHLSSMSNNHIYNNNNNNMSNSNNSRNIESSIYFQNSPKIKQHLEGMTQSSFFKQNNRVTPVSKGKLLLKQQSLEPSIFSKQPYHPENMTSSTTRNNLHNHSNNNTSLTINGMNNHSATAAVAIPNHTSNINIALSPKYALDKKQMNQMIQSEYNLDGWQNSPTPSAFHPQQQKVVHLPLIQIDSKEDLVSPMKKTQHTWRDSFQTIKNSSIVGGAISPSSNSNRNRTQMSNQTNSSNSPLNGGATPTSHLKFSTAAAAVTAHHVSHVSHQQHNHHNSKMRLSSNNFSNFHQLAQVNMGENV